MTSETHQPSGDPTSSSVAAEGTEASGFGSLAELEAAVRKQEQQPAPTPAGAMPIRRGPGRPRKNPLPAVAAGPAPGLPSGPTPEEVRMLAEIRRRKAADLASMPHEAMALWWFFYYGYRGDAFKLSPDDEARLTDWWVDLIVMFGWDTANKWVTLTWTFLVHMKILAVQAATASTEMHKEKP